jgi:hypothetical protein
LSFFGALFVFVRYTPYSFTQARSNFAGTAVMAPAPEGAADDGVRRNGRLNDPVSLGGLQSGKNASATV